MLQHFEDEVKSKTMTNDNLNRLSRLRELSDSDYEIAEGQSDIRNWTVTDERGEIVGSVSDLLFDSYSNKVRYIILDVQKNERYQQSRTVLIPIGIARIHEENDYVIVPNSILPKIETLPDYVSGEVNPGVENMVRHILSGDSDSGAGLTGHPLSENEAEFYSHEHFDEDAFYQMRKDRDGAGQTVVGLFDDSIEAENAVKELVANGYSQESIDLSSSSLNETAINPQNSDDLTAGISNYINTSVDMNDEDQEAFIGGAVVTVKCSSGEEAARARIILDSRGAVAE